MPETLSALRVDALPLPAEAPPAARTRAPSERHTVGPLIVRGERTDGPADPAADALGVEPGEGWPFFIREDRAFALGSGPLWLAHGIQRLPDAILYAAAPATLAALRALIARTAARIVADPVIDPEDVGALVSACAAVAAAEGRPFPNL